jgi:hypothetical protein
MAKTIPIISKKQRKRLLHIPGEDVVTRVRIAGRGALDLM